jgi:hypothetical protein
MLPTAIALNGMRFSCPTAAVTIPCADKLFRRKVNLHCHAASNTPRLTTKELGSVHSLYQLNEVLHQHSLPPTDIRTMAFALEKLAYMGSDSPKGFQLLGMHERVWELCTQVQLSAGSASQFIELKDAAGILGSLEDLVCCIDEISAEHTIIQVRP